MASIRMSRIRMPRLAVAGLLTGITGFAALPLPSSAAPAVRHAVASQLLHGAAFTGAAPLTLSNGTRVAVAAPWAVTAGPAGTTEQARSFMAAGPGGTFCFYGALQSGFGLRSAPAQPSVTKYTLTIKGLNLAGAPDTGDGVQVFSATSMTWNENTIGGIPVFRNGVVTLHVPAGKYWLIGLFRTGNSFRMDIPASAPSTSRPSRPRCGARRSPPAR